MPNPQSLPRSVADELEDLLPALVASLERILPDAEIEVAEQDRRHLARRLAGALGAFPRLDGQQLAPLPQAEAAVRDLLAAERPEAHILCDRRLESPLPARVLIRRARSISTADPAKSLRIAKLATHAASQVDATVWGTEIVRATRLEARSVQVEALLELGELAWASRESQALLVAVDLRVGGRLRGDLHLLAAHVHLRLGELEDAADLLMAARELYEAIGEDLRLGRALLLLGEVYREHGQVDLAVDAARQAVGCFEDGRDREAERCARHNLAIYLCDAGRPGDAWEELVKSRELLGEEAEASVLLSSRWVEGRIREELGEVDVAEGLYRRARKGFLERGAVREAVRVSLDLAGLSVEAGRTREAREVAMWLEAVCRREPGLKEVAVEAVGLREAIREREPDVDLLRRLERLTSLVR